MAREVPEGVGGRPPGSEVPLKVPFVRNPDVAPQRSVITAQFGVPLQPSLRCRGEIKVHPHPNVEKVKDLWMEQPDEIDHEDLALGVRHRRGEPPVCPVIWLMLARLSSPERFQDLTGEPDTIDATPIRGSTVRPGRIQEVITADSHTARDTLGEPRGKRAFPTSTEPGDADDHRRPEAADGASQVVWLNRCPRTHRHTVARPPDETGRTRTAARIVERFPNRCRQ